MPTPKVNYYETLGLNQSATVDEIRRAYRILARRYHPDLNPGKTSEERFKIISLAYQTLSDPDKKRLYDSEIESDRRIRAGFAAYEKAQKFPRNSRTQSAYRSKPGGSKNPANSAKTSAAPDSPWSGLDIAGSLSRSLSRIVSSLTPQKAAKTSGEDITTTKVSVIEVSVSMQDAIFGSRKSVEIPGDSKNRKISLRVPAGVRTGSVLRMRSGLKNAEDYVIIMRVAPDPLIELHPRGILVDIPITVSEALQGAIIKVPGLDQEESIEIPQGSQSGQEIRLNSKGIKYDDGRRGDIFYRLNVMLPLSTHAVGLKEKVAAVNEYYDSPVRQNLRKNLKT